MAELSTSVVWSEEFMRALDFRSADNPLRDISLSSPFTISSTLYFRASLAEDSYPAIIVLSIVPQIEGPVKHNISFYYLNMIIIKIFLRNQCPLQRRASNSNFGLRNLCFSMLASIIKNILSFFAFIKEKVDKCFPLMYEKVEFCHFIIH